MNFLDKLENLLLNSQFSAYVMRQGETCKDKPNISISSTFMPNNEMKTMCMQEFVQYLKNSDIESKYKFLVFFFNLNENNKSIMDDILTLNPTDDDFLHLYNKLHFYDTEFPNFLNLLKDKNSFLQFLKKGNSCTWYVTNNKQFLENCLFKGNRFEFSIQDYYNIFYNYLKNSRTIKDKDSLFDFFIQYIDNDIMLESLFFLLYNEKRTVDKGIDIKNIKQIELHTLGLIKKYKFIISEDLDILLSFFVDCIKNNLHSLSDTISVEKFKSVNKLSGFTEYSLLVDTNNIKECLYLLDLYLCYFVQFNDSAEDFKEHLNDNPEIFQKFILNKKIRDKLTIKDSSNTIRKI